VGRGCLLILTLDLGKRRVDIRQLLLELTDLRVLSCDLLLLLLNFVQKHRRKFIIAHAVDPAVLIADHELRIHLRHFLRVESVLKRALGSVFK